MEPRSVEGCEEEVRGWLEPRRARESSDAVAARCGSGAWVCDSSDRWPAGCDDSRLDELLPLLSDDLKTPGGPECRCGRVGVGYFPVKTPP